MRLLASCSLKRVTQQRHMAVAAVPHLEVQLWDDPTGHQLLPASCTQVHVRCASIHTTGPVPLELTLVLHGSRGLLSHACTLCPCLLSSPFPTLDHVVALVWCLLPSSFLSLPLVP